MLRRSRGILDTASSVPREEVWDGETPGARDP
jgi:hypothetical protein